MAPVPEHKVVHDELSLLGRHGVDLALCAIEKASRGDVAQEETRCPGWDRAHIHDPGWHRLSSETVKRTRRPLRDPREVVETAPACAEVGDEIE